MDTLSQHAGGSSSSRGKIDFDRINSDTLARYPDILYEWLPGGKVEGHEFKATNPTRSDNKKGSFSININNGKWGDFATGDSGGDPVSLYAYLSHTGQGDAAKELGDRLGTDQQAASRREIKKQTNQSAEPTWKNLSPVPADAPKPPGRHYKFGSPAMRWAYLDADGALLGYICRFDLPDGGKEVWPLTFCESKTEKKWRWQSFAKPRPMYGLDRLAARPDANVVVVEGEKCADVLQKLLPDLVVVSWPGGGKAVKHTDWSPLTGLKVVIFPDNDEPGGKAALEIVDILSGKAAGLRLVKLPDGKPKGWDCADAILVDGWDAGEMLQFIQHNLIDPADLQQEDTPPPPAYPPHEEPPLQTESPANKVPPELGYEAEPVDLGAPSTPFLSLGYDHGSYFYLPRGSNQVVELKAEQHSQKNLMTLAPQKWWERRFPGRKGPSWGSAANVMFRFSESRGVYDSGRIRGRGAWEDKGRAVLHLGGHLVIDGQRQDLAEFDSRFIYEAAASMNQGVHAQPLAAKEASRFIELCANPTWEKPINAKLLAGWCVVAPICGALQWRPHIWVTGPAGSGKSWVVDNVLRVAVGPAALMVQSNTTEAGLRQELKHDARPVVFDEAEGEDQAARRRIQNVLELMRQASTESGAAILKGTTGGKAMSFRIRSCFAFSSIGVNLQQHADVSRVTVLGLLPRFGAPPAVPLPLKFYDGLRARAVSLIPIIRKNSEIFGEAAATFFKNQRTGDQLGALLAGAYALHSSSVISLEKAREWVEAQEWGDAAPTDHETDEARCLTAILGHVFRVEGDQTGHELTIGEAIQAAISKVRLHVDISPDKANAALRRCGIRAEEEAEVFYVSNTAKGIKSALLETPWGTDWSRILSRLPGAKKSAGTIHFAGSSTRAIAVPLHFARHDT